MKRNQSVVPAEFLQRLQPLTNEASYPFFLVAVPDMMAINTLEVIAPLDGSKGRVRKRLFPKGSGLLSESLPDKAYLLHNGNVWLKIKAYPRLCRDSTRMDKLPGGACFTYRTSFLLLVGDGSVLVTKWAYTKLDITPDVIKSLSGQLLQLKIQDLYDFNFVPLEEAFVEHDRIEAGARKTKKATTVGGGAIHQTTVYEDGLINQVTLGATLVHLQELVAKHGGNAKIAFDAGYNNISVLVDPVKA